MRMQSLPFLGGVVVRISRPSFVVNTFLFVRVAEEWRV